MAKEGGSRCHHCALNGWRCDGVSVASARESSFSLFFFLLLTSAVNRTSKEQERIEKEIEKSEEILQEALARLSRLRRQRDSLKSRSAELFERGMRQLDEEDGVRSQEEAILEEQQAIGAAQSVSHLDLIDWSSVLDGPSLFGDTAEPIGGSSSGV